MSDICKIPKLRQRIFDMLGEGLPGRMVLLGSETGRDHDSKLRELTVALGFVAGNLKNDTETARNLAAILGICFGWAISLGASMPFDKINDERERQHELFISGHFTFTCASTIVDPTRKLRVLTEEVGEVANAIDELECARDTVAHLKKEIIQVAAVALGWLESLVN